MYCQHCEMKWREPAIARDENQEPVTICPKCQKQMFDTNYTQFCERKAENTYAIDAAGVIFCVETNEPLQERKPAATKLSKPFDRNAWEEKKRLEELAEDKYLAQFGV